MVCVYFIFALCPWHLPKYLAHTRYLINCSQLVILLNKLVHTEVLEHLERTMYLI